ncbi:MAG: hypothetical protein JWN76_1975 [Chitinophagaceae bacterium]|nr:hypothetical protein [Chitinophagaceae bacterium]
MKRRQFVKDTLASGVVLPGILGGFSVRAFSEDAAFVKALMAPSTDNDHVLVLIQLTGGNDGLNTVIPLEVYSNYVNARTNIAIPENKVLTLAGTKKLGLHPAMTGLQSLFNEGKATIVESVGYPSPSFSHFRATDIWMSASDSSQVVDSGWAGRYLNYEYPNFPNGYPNSTMTDPLAIQIGSITSLTLQGPAVSMGMSISNTSNFYNFLNGSTGPAPATPAGKELSYIREIAQQTQQYATVIKDAAGKVTQQIVYPSGNTLGDQLKIVARLIKGGLHTRVYMVTFGSFDTHAQQANAADTSTGTHAVLLQKVSDAIKAFQDDLKFLGVEDRVVGMTFSEFGRRIKSNASGGTDHGAAAPLFVFGKQVLPGVIGNAPPLPANATVNDNLPFQYDFRSVYATLLENWLCVPNKDLQTIMLKNFQTLPLVNTAACKTVNPNNSGDNLISNYPNPFTTSTTISFTTAGGHTLIQVIDMTGRVISNLVDREYTPGKYKVTFNGGTLPTGVYYARLQNMSVQQVRAMIKVQ